VDAYIQISATSDPAQPRPIRRHAGPPSPPPRPVAAILVNLGIVLDDLKEDRSARLAYERVLAIHENDHRPDHPRVAYNLVNLAGTYVAARQPRAALPMLKRAVGDLGRPSGRPGRALVGCRCTAV